MSIALLNAFLNISLLSHFSVTTPSTEQLALELSGGSTSHWPSDGQYLVTKLSMKYVILHRIE